MILAELKAAYMNKMLRSTLNVCTLKTVLLVPSMEFEIIRTSGKNINICEYSSYPFGSV